MRCFSSFVLVLVVVITFCAQNALADSVCSTKSDVFMSQGFITAALSSISPLGVGYCTNNLCDTSLAACQNSTCCLPNYGGNSGPSPCGCLRELASGSTKCVDPKLLKIDVTACDKTSQANHQISVQLFSSHNKTQCVSQTKSELVMTADGNPAIQISAVICSTKDTREHSPPQDYITIEIPKNDVVYFTVGGTITLNSLSSDTSKLYEILGSEQVERLLTYKQSF